MTEAELQAFADRFAFKFTLSFDPLVKYWEKEAQKEHPVMAPLARQVLAELDEHPELTGAIADQEILSGYKEVVDRIMCGMFSHTFWESDHKGVMAPFNDRCFYHTPLFGEILERSYKQIENYESEELLKIARYRITNAFYMILDAHYGVPFAGRNHMTHHITDPETGFNQFFGIKINPEFMEVRVHGELPELSSAEIDELLMNMDDLELWASKMPPELFEFYGIAVVEMTDKTEEQLFSDIKEDLLENNALFVAERFVKLEHQFRNLFGSDRLQVHIGAFNKQAGVFLKFRRNQATQIISTDDKMLMPFAKDILDAEGIDRMKPFVVRDMTELKLSERLKCVFKDEDIKSLMYVPLMLDGEMLGIALVKSDRIGDLSPESWLKFERYVPILATVVRRSSELFDERIRTIIKENYTALHAAAEWKFNEVAIKYLKDREALGDQAELEPVLFEGVYPLYGASDIRNSSLLRNEAIRADLLRQLRLAKETLDAILQVKPFPIYHELAFELDGEIDALSEEMHTQDEEHVLHKLHDNIEPVFRLMSDTVPKLKETVQRYFDALDPRLHIIYERRKDFDESVERVNRSLVSIIETEEIRSQAAYPFYFENFKTDGVDYNIYIGKSLSRNIHFDPIYLRNLRLWQMLVTCKVALEGNRLKSDLPVQLDLTHLILAHSAPLDIRFREDENRFDVDGAYNIRYEIIKKRIDKAMIKGSNERITQPGKLAVIFNSDEMQEEYMQYFRYVSHLGLTEGEVEVLDVEDLQGISGLKALRVNLNYAADPIIEQALHKELEEIGEVSLSNR